MTSLLIDSNNLAHISFHAMGDLSDNEVDTGCLYGFTTALFKLQKTFKPEKMIFCFDSRKNYRKLIYPEYKANRKKEDKTPEEKERIKSLYKQITTLRKEFLFQMGFTNVFIKTGYEADDLIADIVKNYPEESFTIVSTDQDLYQLLRENILIHNPITKKGITKSSFEKEYGISSKKWHRVKAIAGCSSDNVKGIVGVGEKTAIKYLNKELNKKSKKYQDIINGNIIIKKNKKVVKLPYSELNLKTKKQPQLKKSNFIDVFDNYRFDSILNKATFKKWIDEFKLI